MINKQKRFISLLMAALFAASFIPIFGCTDGSQVSDNSNTRIFVDSCGRSVEIPETLTRIAPSGQVAQMMIYAVNPDALIGWGDELSDTAMRYIDERYQTLPVFGQFYGKNVSLNMEALIAANPEVIIDMGNMKSTHAEDMNSIQEQTGIPTIFIQADADTYADAMKTLGELMGQVEQGNALGAYITETFDYAEDKRAELNEDDIVGVYFGTGESGLDANAAGSIHATVIDTVGARNVTVVEEVSSKGGGNTINMERLYELNPDVIILMPDGAYENALNDPLWQELEAVQNGNCYEVPTGPFNFMANPPSINAIIGIRWLGCLIYPELYDMDMVEEAKRFYELFWHYDLSEDEARELMKNSIYKNDTTVE